jgi:aminoglycoside phosphotransferase (APT) family kinase protein
MTAEKAGKAETESPDQSRSTRDFSRLRCGLESWLARRLPPGSAPRVPELTAPPNVGQSSDTLLFEACWQEDGATRTRRLVARVAPQEADLPLFPSYDLSREYQAMRTVARLTEAPVPEALWLELDPSPLGSPFLVMGHVEGEVPSDVRYILDGFVARGSDADRRRLQESTVEALACLHAVPGAASEFAFLGSARHGETPLRAHVARTASWYEYARARGGRFPLIERGFRWIEDHWPAEGDPVATWGDARIGNVLYRDFRPAALLDWELSALGPRELDLAWLVASHRVFEDMLGGHGRSGLPGFLLLEDVAAEYQALTGYSPRDMDFYLTYAALQWSIIMVSANLRRLHFGQIRQPADDQDLVINRATLTRLLDGADW